MQVQKERQRDIKKEKIYLYSVTRPPTEGMEEEVEDDITTTTAATGFDGKW